MLPSKVPSLFGYRNSMDRREGNIYRYMKKVSIYNNRTHMCVCSIIYPRCAASLHLSDIMAKQYYATQRLCYVVTLMAAPCV